LSQKKVVLNIKGG